MRSSQRLLAVMLFAAVSLLALACSGMMDWLASSLFLALELLAETLRRLFGVRPAQRPKGHHRGHPPTKARPRKALRHREFDCRPGRRDEPEPVSEPRPRVLLPLSDDRPGLVEFALQECRSRRAELLVLFLRPLAVLPMGQNPVPTLDEDAEARAILEGLGVEAGAAGVPLRTLYRVTADRAATLIDAARELQANVVVMESVPRSWLATLVSGDMTRAVLSRLPEHVSLIVHAA